MHVLALPRKKPHSDIRNRFRLIGYTYESWRHFCVLVNTRKNCFLIVFALSHFSHLFLRYWKWGVRSVKYRKIAYVNFPKKNPQRTLLGISPRDSRGIFTDIYTGTSKETLPAVSSDIPQEYHSRVLPKISNGFPWEISSRIASVILPGILARIRFGISYGVPSEIHRNNFSEF